MKKVLVMVFVFLMMGILPVMAEEEYHYTFEGDDTDSSGTFYGNAKIENGVLTLDGTNGTYFALPQGSLDDCDEFTVSMDIKTNMASGNFFTFTIGNTDQKYVYLRIKSKEVRLVRSVEAWRNEQGFNYIPDNDLSADFYNYTIVSTKDSLSLYIDGKLVGEANTTTTNSDIGTNLSVMLGKSTYSPDLYFSGSYDNVHVYKRALTEKEIIGSMDTDKLFDKDVNDSYFVNCNEITADLLIPETGKRSGCNIDWKSGDEGIVTQKGKINRTNKKQTVTMTATFTLGDKNVVKTYDLTILPNEDDYAYLFAYFTNNSADQERLFYGVSLDGYNFKALNGGKSVLTSTLGTGCIRDPFIMKGEDGYYYIIATDMRSSLGWSSNYATVVYKTPDLINIVDKEWINYRNFPLSSNCTRAWAPQAIWCPEKDAYMVYITMEMPDDDYNTVMFRHYATDLCDASTYTDLELMLDQPEGMTSAIDGDIIYDKYHDEYIMYFNGKQLATSKTLSGQWSHTGKELPMYTEGGVSMSVEGSNIWKIIDEDKWVIAADGTPFNGGCYALVETTDFENYTQLWEHNGDYSFDFTPRHGYVIPISKREYDNLISSYGAVSLSGTKNAVYFGVDKGIFQATEDAIAVVASYDENGCLVNIQTKPFTGETEIDFTPPGKGTVKLMLWNKDIKPLCENKIKAY